MKVHAGSVILEPTLNGMIAREAGSAKAGLWRSQTDRAFTLARE